MSEESNDDETNYTDMIKGYLSPELIRDYFVDDFKEKMNKTYELLKFYKKNNVEIKFRLINRPTFEIVGKIEELPLLFFSRGDTYVSIRENNKPPIKIFIEDIDYLTIFPIHIQQKPTYIKADRINIPQGLRFDILRRDNNTCQYCGRTPPEVELEIDHVIPVSAGGSNDINNLITSCRDCNRGKSNKEVD